MQCRDIFLIHKQQLMRILFSWHVQFCAGGVSVSKLLCWSLCHTHRSYSNQYLFGMPVRNIRFLLRAKFLHIMPPWQIQHNAQIYLNKQLSGLFNWKIHIERRRFFTTRLFRLFCRNLQLIIGTKFLHAMLYRQVQYNAHIGINGQLSIMLSGKIRH